MQSKSTEWALVTGASGGIGLELAQCFASDGINLVLVARSGQLLDVLASRWTQQYQIQVVSLPMDLAQAHAPDEIRDALVRSNIRVSYLVNNAGVGLFGRYHQTDIEREHQMILLNCVALTRLTKLFLADMLQQGRGRILNVASTASFQPGPYQAVYFATKAYVLSFSEAIAEDLGGTGVSVTALCPGLTGSGFVKAAGMEHSAFVKGSALAGAKQVAATGYAAMNRQQRVAVPGLINWLYSLAPRFFPRRLVTKVLARMMTPAVPPAKSGTNVTASS